MNVLLTCWLQVVCFLWLERHISRSRRQSVDHFQPRACAFPKPTPRAQSAYAIAADDMRCLDFIVPRVKTAKAVQMNGGESSRCGLNVCDPLRRLCSEAVVRACQCFMCAFRSRTVLCVCCYSSTFGMKAVDIVHASMLIYLPRSVSEALVY
jgi:hypothetical protein